MSIHGINLWSDNKINPIKLSWVINWGYESYRTERISL